MKDLNLIVGILIVGQIICCWLVYCLYRGCIDMEKAFILRIYALLGEKVKLENKIQIISSEIDSLKENKNEKK